jgi:hypothetical protein
MGLPAATPSVNAGAPVTETKKRVQNCYKTGSASAISNMQRS